MKITAEFNSVEEVLSFASTFGKSSFKLENEPVQIPVVQASKEGEKTVEIKTEVTELAQKGIKAEPPKETKITKGIKEDAQKDKQEKTKITKEMVRERLGAIMKAGKQNEVKRLVAKYGANKVPELKKEDYEAVYKEAEGLL